VKAVAAFLTSDHEQHWARLTAWSRDVLQPRPEPASDAAARSEATKLLRVLGDAGLLKILRLGVLVGHPVEQLYRSVRALRIYEGATDIQRLIVAGAYLDEARRS
jgi:acyl-CoA dehydrogenase